MAENNTFLIKTLGCKVNSYESEFIRNLFLLNNYKEVEDNADVVKKSKRCQKIYSWVHDIYGEFLGTREQLETLYSLDTRPLFTTHKPKRTTKGWSLSPQQPE